MKLPVGSVAANFGGGRAGSVKRGIEDSLNSALLRARKVGSVAGEPLGFPVPAAAPRSPPDRVDLGPGAQLSGRFSGDGFRILSGQRSRQLTAPPEGTIHSLPLLRLVARHVRLVAMRFVAAVPPQREGPMAADKGRDRPERMKIDGAYL